MYKKHSYEERLLAVQKCLEGQAPEAVGHQMHIDPHDVREWLLRYELEGISGLEKRPMKHAEFAEKCKIVCEYAEKGVPLHRISATYHVSQYAVKSWTRIYRKGGYDALRNIKPQGKGRLGMGRPKKHLVGNAAHLADGRALKRLAIDDDLIWLEWPEKCFRTSPEALAVLRGLARRFHCGRRISRWHHPARA